MKISLGSDHAGFRYKEAVKAHLSGLGHEVVDFGTDSAESCDYPVFIRPAAEAVAAAAVAFRNVLRDSEVVMGLVSGLAGFGWQGGNVVRC